VKILSQSSAKVIIGDVNVEAAEALCKECPGTTFVRTDVTKYDEIYNLFKKAYDDYGRVDSAVCCAGIFGTYRMPARSTVLY
jgi:NAD(P)-dependent dehydrogenase (short-subunit alcohol dehydrogenase family)